MAHYTSDPRDRSSQGVLAWLLLIAGVVVIVNLILWWKGYV